MLMHGLGIVSENVEKCIKKGSSLTNQDLERIMQ